VYRILVNRLLIFVLSLALALAIALGLASVAMAEARLRAAVAVAASEITLADLFDGAGPEARAVVVARSPAAGERLVLRVQDIAALAERAGIAWQGPQGLRAVTVVRQTQEVPKSLLVEHLRKALARQARDHNFDIQISSGRAALIVPADAAPTLRIADLDFDPASGRFTASVIAPADGAAADTVRVAGRVFSISQVPVLRARVNLGETIDAGDIAWLAVPVERIDRNMITRAEDLVGRQLRRPVMPQTPMRAGDVQRPELVAKGALVSMILSAPGMSLTATGQALESGGAGDVIQVANAGSRRVVPATIIGPNQVRVAAPGRPLAAAAAVR
jgi:flagellar basal body P-ring formation protein FlgA